MVDSIVFYAGLIMLLIGLLALLSTRRRRHGALLVGAGMIAMIVVLLLPAHERRSATRESRLDDLMPAWQFRELHATHVAASPERVSQRSEVSARTTSRSSGRSRPSAVSVAAAEKAF